MISLTWFIFFFFNILILLVILMNFLIAIVSETYALVMQNEVANIFYFRAILNQEYYEIWAEKSYTKQVDFSHILFMTEVTDNGESKTGAPELVKIMKRDLDTVKTNFSENKNKLAS